MDENSERRMDIFKNAISGAVAGIVSRIIISPFDVIKIRLQLQSTSIKYNSVTHAIKLMLKEEGIRSFWKGNASASILYCTYGAMQFATYPELKRTCEQLNLPSTFISGALAGSLATVATYPFDLLRTRFAAQGSGVFYPSLASATLTIARQEGLKGLMPTLVQIVPLMGLLFSTHTFFKQYTSNELVSGALAGIVSKTLTMPFDVVRKRMQVQGPVRLQVVVTGVPVYSGMVQCFTGIVKHEGIKGFFRGWWPTMLKSAPSSAVTFFVVNRMKVWLDKR